MVTTNLKYTLATLLLFVIEILIALFAHDDFIRPYFGDFLVVILIYCFLKSIWNTPTVVTAISVLVFSYAIETLQYFHWLQFLGLEKSKLARIIMGNSFAWNDLLAYTLGIAFIIGLEKYMQTTEKPAYLKNTRN